MFLCCLMSSCRETALYCSHAPVLFFMSCSCAVHIGRRVQEMLGEVFQQPDLHGDAEAESDASVDSGAEEGEVDGVRVNPNITDHGKRVLFVSQDKREKCGVLRYIGTPEFADGTWCGIELDEALGKNNGSIHGIRYFSCEARHGVFVPVGKVKLESAQRVYARPVNTFLQPMLAFAPRRVGLDSPLAWQQHRGGTGLRPLFRARGMENLHQVEEWEGSLAERTSMKNNTGAWLQYNAVSLHPVFGTGKSNPACLD